MDVTVVVTTEHGDKNAVAKTKVLGLHPISLHKKTTAFNGTGRSTTLFKNAVSLSWSHVPLSDDLLCSVQPMRTRSRLIFFLSLEGLGSQWMSQTQSSTPTSLDSDEYDPMLELLCHAHIAAFMEA